jgi:HK97 family phage major capsid protein
MLTTWIDSRLSYAVLLKQEQYLINDATNGLLVLATAQTVPTGATTTLDLVAAAIGQLTAAGYTPDGVVMNPSDITDAQLMKDTQGRYIWSSPDASVGTSAIWTLPLVESPSMPAKQFIVAAFSESTILFDRQMLTLDISYENKDDFVKNLACFRAEMRLPSVFRFRPACSKVVCRKTKRAPRVSRRARPRGINGTIGNERTTRANSTAASRF